MKEAQDGGGAKSCCRVREVGCREEQDLGAPSACSVHWGPGMWRLRHSLDPPLVGHSLRLQERASKVS